jgi:cholesterol oxidase|tara:strand:- start:861 stop:1856 length:996 start_codon:yes stop_codon:yes gene_type:complete
MVGCRYNAKNTLDKNYLYLAQKEGTKVLAESKVVDVKPLGNKNGSEGYEVAWEQSTSLFFGKSEKLTCKGVIFSGGVLGTVKLLLKLKKSSLPILSDQLGNKVRTNSEALMPVTALDKKTDYSKGVAIGSILHIGEHSHLEPVRYSKGSGFWRLIMLPRVEGKSFIVRFYKIIADFIKHPINNFKTIFVDDWAQRTQVLLFMQTLDSTLNFSERSFGLGMKTGLEEGKAPTPFIPEAQSMAEKYAEIMDGKPMMPNNEALFGIPTTAHILGGACMGKNINEGVIDKNNYVFGYENMLVCDGSMISANPGVNPSLTITALTERAMSFIPNAL